MGARGFFRVAVVTLALTTVPAVASSMTDYDVQKAETWADALAICDVTRFLLTQPNLDASAIIALTTNNSHVPLYKPLFIPPSSFFSEAMRQTYERVKAAGQVTPQAYQEARMRYARLMLNSYRQSNPTDRVFMLDQMRLCYALAVDTSGKARTP